MPCVCVCVCAQCHHIWLHRQARGYDELHFWPVFCFMATSRNIFVPTPYQPSFQKENRPFGGSAFPFHTVRRPCPGHSPDRSPPSPWRRSCQVGRWPAWGHGTGTATCPALQWTTQRNGGLGRGRHSGRNWCCHRWEESQEPNHSPKEMFPASPTLHPPPFLCLLKL